MPANGPPTSRGSLAGRLADCFWGWGGIGWWMLGRNAPILDDSASLPIRRLSRGQTLFLEIPTSLDKQSGGLSYKLADAPTDATIDARRGVVSWPTGEIHPPGDYRFTVTASAANQSAEQTFLVRVSKAPLMPDSEPTDFSVDDTPTGQDNPFETTEELKPKGKIDEFVFAKLKELKIEPSNPCSDGAFPAARLSRHARYVAHG